MAIAQNFLILAYLKHAGPLTQLDALRRIGSMRLGARIWELRSQGHKIETDYVTVKTRAGKARVARYRYCGLAR